MVATLGRKPCANEHFEKISATEFMRILSSKMLHGIDGADPKDQPILLVTASTPESDCYFRF